MSDITPDTEVATRESICNLALANIRVPAITSFDDCTTEADACAQVYNELCEQAFGEFPWNFCKVSAVLQMLPYSDCPLGWMSLWQLPRDVMILRTIKVTDGDSALSDGTYANDWAQLDLEESAVRWDRWQDDKVTVQTNPPADDGITPSGNSAAVAIYTRRVGEARMPPYFRAFLSAKLQATLAGSITGKSEYVDAAEKLEEKTRKIARLRDSQARTPPRARATRFLTYR